MEKQRIKTQLNVSLLFHDVHAVPTILENLGKYFSLRKKHSGLGAFLKILELVAYCTTRKVTVEIVTTSMKNVMFYLL